MLKLEPLHCSNIPCRGLLVFVAMILSTGLVGAACGDEQEKFYIVHLGENVMKEESAHVDVLTTLKGSEDEAKESIVHSYTKSFNAFAARLSEDEAEELSGMEEVLSVVPNRYHKLHTTRSWDFLGLPQTARRKLQTEGDIIVGVLDTGITPQSESFKDKGFGPPPTKWKGTCDRFANFSGCNNKLIGARYFKLDGNTDPADILSPVDVDGHGTHTSSTLAGNLVPNANLFGLAKGTARGAVPSARVAMYKVCWASSGCSDMDILAAFEAAIHDGVDVISISIGGQIVNYAGDSISVGSYHAMRKGIVTAASAGNGGPEWASVLNHAPWIVTVAASSIDREFKNRVELGNGQSFMGVGVSDFGPKQKTYPLVSGADVYKDSLDKQSARLCLPNSLDSSKVKGKLVFCELGAWGVDSVVKGIGGVGTIVESTQYLDVAQIFMSPATMVNNSVGTSIDNYIHASRSPSAVIYKSQELKAAGAPVVASFSSRGPNTGTQRILKPDIAAPGIDILAAYTPMKTLTGLKGDTQYSKFTLMSGTSMACPHVAGVAAYIKSFHPSWTPAAVKSAIMTTAKPMSKRKDKTAEFGFGAGQINPTKALNPGLVFNIDDEMPYIQFLCREGYAGSAIATLVGSKSINCSSLLPGLGHDVLNYPSMQLSLDKNRRSTTVTFRRRVTNVGPAVSVYNATVRAPRGVEVVVEPMVLEFSRVGQRRSFKVVVKGGVMGSGDVVSGSVVWRSLRYVVRSPIVVYRPLDE